MECVYGRGFKPSAHYVPIAGKHVGETAVLVQDTQEIYWQ